MAMTLDIIRTLHVSHEGVDVEFKKSTGQLNRGMETLCGMLNSKGGSVIFGVTDNGVMTGQEIGDKTTREIGEALSHFEPSISIQPEYIDLGGGKYLIVLSTDCQSAEDKPYQWEGRAYQRHDSVTTVMPLERLSRMLEKSKGGLRYKWEGIVNGSLSIADLDEQRIINVVRGGIRRGRLNETVLDESIESILSRLKIMQDGRLCNAAAVLFGRNMFDYPQCMIRLARFKGNDKYEFIDNIQTEGNIYELLNAAMAFFFKHLSLHGKIEGIERDDKLEVPYKALRECCVNSLAHRAWQRETSTIGIAIYDDRIEIENAGHFPHDLSPDIFTGNEDILKSHSSEAPNPIIAQIMYLSGLIEKWGRGLALMFEECRKAGIPDPRILETGNMVKVIFQRPTPDKATVGPQSGHSRATVGPQSGHSKDMTIPDSNEIKVIMALADSVMSAKELRESVGYKSRQRFNVNYIQPAIANGYIKRENETSVNASNQRYLLTEKGLSYYHAHKKS